MAHLKRIDAMKRGFKTKAGKAHMSFLVKKKSVDSYVEKKNKEDEIQDIETNYRKSLLMGKKLYQQNQHLKGKVKELEKGGEFLKKLKEEFKNLTKSNEELEENLIAMKQRLQGKELMIDELRTKSVKLKELEMQHERVMKNNTQLRKKNRDLDTKVKVLVEEKGKAPAAEVQAPVASVVEESPASKDAIMKLKRLENLNEQLDIKLKAAISGKEKMELDHRFQLKKLEQHFKEKLAEKEKSLLRQIEEKDEHIVQLKEGVSKPNFKTESVDMIHQKEHVVINYIEENFKKLKNLATFN